MKKFKTTDLWLSIILITGFAIASLVTLDGMIMITGYFIVGGWQVISMIVHAYYDWFNEKKSVRRVYNWITVFSLLSFPVGSFVILLFIAPVMAVYYAWICYEEVYVKMQRPIALLK
jgi:hypothetical protein